MPSRRKRPRAERGPTTLASVVLGGASCVWDDLLALEGMLGRQWNGLIACVNDVGVHWPRYMSVWASLHPYKFAYWRAQRARHGFPNGYLTYGPSSFDCDVLVRPWPVGGSSGMLAVQALLEMAHSPRVVLCGVPMTITKHFEESTEEHYLNAEGVWHHAEKHWPAWELYAQDGRLQHVRSMSGETRALLGAPTRKWIEGV